MLTLEDLAEILESDPAAFKTPVREFPIFGRHFPLNSQPAIMGVVNLSPGSWYRESVSLTREAAFERSIMLKAQGADLIDLGAESTLAHTERVGASKQIQLLSGLIRDLASEKIPVSVETYHAPVARAALESGAAVLNITGAGDLPEILSAAADHGAAVILCYVESRGEGASVRDVTDFDLSSDPIPRMRDFFSRQIELAQKHRVDRLFIDPGLGFYYRNLQDSAQRVRHQMRTFLHTFRLRSLGFPICHALPHAFEYFRDEVRSAEAFFAVLAALGRTNLFRTHEVPKIRAVLQTLEAY